MEPWGQWRDNAHAAVVASVIANAHRKKGTKAFDWQDFMLVDKDTDRARKTAQSLAWLRSNAKRKPKDPL